MELRQLSYFVAVAEELHFGRAAMRVNIAQPALSTQVQALEKSLGVQLLLRSTRRVELTRAGEVFYDRCVRMLSDLELSAEMARSVAGKTVREIRIGTIYPATTGVLPAFLSRIGRKVPRHPPACLQRLDQRHHPPARMWTHQSGFHPPSGEHRLATLLFHCPLALSARGV